MNWIDQNLDAYRVIAEILTDLRPLVRERLEQAFGKDWFRTGIPDETFDRLIRNKEQETSIDWYENRYQEVIGYAVFPDLLEIVAANHELFRPIVDLAPSASLLHARFLELEVMRAKIGRARQISDAEINFLTSFHLRFRKAIQEQKGAEAVEAQRTSSPGSAAGASDVSNDREQIDVETVEDNGDGENESAAAVDSDATTPVSMAVTGTVQPLRKPASPGRPPQRLAAPTTSVNRPKPPPVKEDRRVEEAAAVDIQTDDVDREDAGEPRRETAATLVKRALENRDDRGVLREIYREVTGIAEGIWTAEELPSTAIWERVSTSDWYERSFSKLELRPLSDFYEIVSQVRARRKAGTSKAELQSYLNDSKFASVLLALRDMFQKNAI